MVIFSDIRLPGKHIIQEVIRLNPYWQISCKFLRPFNKKTHPSKIMSNQFFEKKTGRELERFTGKLIQSSI